MLRHLQRAHRHLHGSRTFKIAALYLVWLGIAAAFFSASFLIDRSRWVYYRLTGYNLTRSEEKSHLAEVPVRAFLAYNRQFVADPDVPGDVLLPPAEHVFDRTVVVPRGTQLTIAARRRAQERRHACAASASSGTRRSPRRAAS